MMLNKSAAERALGAAMSTGGDFAEIFMEDSISSAITANSGKIEAAQTSRGHGAGIRVYLGLKSVYVYTNDTSEAGLVKSAYLAADAIGNVQTDASVKLVRSIAANAHRISLMPGDADGHEKVNILKAMCGAAESKSPEIARTVAGISGKEQSVAIANTDGLFVNDTRVYSRCVISAIASNENANQTGAEVIGGYCGFELFKNGFDPEGLGRNAAESALTMLHADLCPAGRMPVVLEAGIGGIIFHEACGHSLEATSVAYGNSEFCGKLGTRIAASCVTAIDDGMIPNAWGSLNIDDEGTPTSKLVLIENGILKNYMVDRLNGRRMNMPVTGSARRQNYTFAPTSRMRNTYIAAGSDDENEIISSCPYGLYAKKIGGGSVNPLTGEYNFSVSEGYIIKNGKIDKPVRNAMLIGKGGDTIMNIDRVGREVKLADGICGSLSGSVNTCVGQPRIRVKELTVGGRK